ncbi:MAG: hypothetical protein GF364_15580 [Candidatus Lokiarchaeota archaeon]|nr:hypothetical protein [Candidatus Lokiarchaeota archaeon]
MPLNGKQRLWIILSTLLIAIGGMAGNQLSIVLEGGHDINVKDAYFFSSDYYATYSYINESNGIESTLQIKGDNLDSDHTNVTIYLNDTLQGDFIVHPDGYVYNLDTLIDGNYSIWWIFVPNVFMMLGINEGDTYDVIDPTGFCGAAFQNYSLIVDKRMVYWPVDPIQANLSGAQSSFEASMYESLSHKKIAKVTFDVTCGVIEEWEGLRSGDWIKFRLIGTSFPISRNRRVCLMFNLIIGSLLVGVTIILISFDWKSTKLKWLSRFTLEKNERRELLLLQGTGFLCVILEVIDIWFYMYLGRDLSMYVHLGVFAWMLLLGHTMKYGYKWALPAFLEVAFVFAIGWITGEAYVPSLTANIGSLIGWLALVWASSVKEKMDGDVKGVKKFFADLI